MRVLGVKQTALLWVFASICTLRGDALDHWTVRTSDTGRNLHSVAYGSGRFVAVGQWGTILVSTNGTNWSATATNLTTSLYGVAWSEGRFVCVGDAGSILTSPDGLEWLPQTSPTSNSLRAVRWVADRFIAVGSNGTLLSSTDGQSWVQHESGSTHTLNGVAFGNGVFTAVGGGNTHVSSVMRSLDGVTWSNRAVGFNYLYDVTFGNGRFLAVGVRGQVHYSTNALDWVHVFRTVDSTYLFGATFAQGMFVGVGGPYGGGGQKIVTSTDGVHWNRRPVKTSLSPVLRAVAYGNGFFIAVGEKGIILQSDPFCRLTPAPRNLAGQLQWTLAGEIGRSFHFQWGSDATGTNWTDITNFTASAEAVSLSDTTTNQEPVRFYRVISP